MNMGVTGFDGMPSYHEQQAEFPGLVKIGNQK